MTLQQSTTSFAATVATLSTTVTGTVASSTGTPSPDMDDLVVCGTVIACVLLYPQYMLKYRSKCNFFNAAYDILRLKLS